MSVWNCRNPLLLVAVTLALQGCLPSAMGVQPGAAPSVPAQINSPPVISGTPATQIAAGSHYVFQPTANDSDGDILSFSATGLPTWASIDPATGRVEGTPGSADAGTTAGIVVRVSDGTDRVSLPAFAVLVMGQPVVPEPGTGIASLSWTVPVEYTDGSPLPADELLGYRVYHGTSAASLVPYHDVEGAAVTAYEARGLATGQHCFAVSAVSVTNVESALSTVGCKQI